jgi:cytoskeletal protein RodZ
MEAIVWILVIIISIILFSFFLGRFIGSKISDLKAKKKLNEIYDASQLRPKDKPKPSDEFQARDERKEIVTGKVVSQEYKRLQEKEVQFKEGLVQTKEKSQLVDNTAIVDVAKPVGFWSRLIISQKLNFMINFTQQMNNNNKHGYFVNLIRAQARSQSKEKGRNL